MHFTPIPDFTLLYLDDPFRGRHIKPIFINNYLPNEKLKGKTIRIFGWGKKNEDSLSDHLLMSDVHVREILNDAVLKLDHNEGKLSCPGDSGGRLFM